MATVKRRPNFLDTDEGIQTEQVLRSMEANNMYNTESSYSANAVTHPDHRISFADKHMKYLSEHQAVDIDHYLSNLRLMTRVK